MSEEAESGVDTVQGAIQGRGGEPAHGEADDGHTHERACLNCAAVLVGSHCHACGQAAHVHRTLGAFFHDLLHGVFHFEGKVWRTVPLLAWNPGKLTREYIDGRRASYVSPIALFLFVVFLTFATVRSVGEPMHFGGPDADGIAAATRIDKARAEVSRLERERASAVSTGRATTAIDTELKNARGAVQALEMIENGELPAVKGSGDGSQGSALLAGVAEAWRHVRENPELALYKLQTSAYKFAWLLIVLSVPFVWLLFPFSRRFQLYDHMVFVTYSLSFMMLILSALTLVTGWSLGGVTGWLVAILLLTVPFHLYRQVKGAYLLGTLGALWRTAALAVIALFVVTLWALALMALVAA